ncbi:MAG: tryptophan--tRNA ligase [Patescibacteria group bacterium]
MAKPIIVSGVKPSGKLHLGNYLGALNNWLKIQNSNRYRCLFFIADYHSLTTLYNPQKKRGQIFDVACDYLAAGLDPKKSIIFIQSQVPECTELAWIFNTLTPVSELERMAQFKDKAKRQKQNVNMGLFDYPVLQAADILLYKGELVPVGQDQIQHVELTRDCAKWFNNKYKVKYFPESKPLLTETPKIMSLISPENKMEKTLGDKHCLYIDEPAEAIAAKLAKAVSTPAGIENLKTIYQAFKEKMAGEFNPEKMAETKKIIAEGIANYFADFRAQKEKLKKDKKLVLDILAEGRQKAQAIAQKNMAEIKKIIGVE